MKEKVLSAKLYVGNLDYDANENDVNELFSNYGEVLSAIVVRNKDDGTSKGFAFVEMETIDEAQKAADGLDAVMFMGRAITVNEAREKAAAKAPAKRVFESSYKPGTKKLYVGNLPFSVTEDDIKDLFSSAGEVKNVKIIVDQDTKRSKGFCFIEMSDERGAKKAVETLNDIDVGGRTINVNSARENEKPKK